MNLHLKTGLGNKNYVLDPNSDVENEFFLTDFLWQFWAKNTKINFSSESVKTKEHKESNSCDKYHFSINAFYKINLWPILKKLLQKIDFHHFPLFEIIAQKYQPDWRMLFGPASCSFWDWRGYFIGGGGGKRVNYFCGWWGRM